MQTIAYEAHGNLYLNITNRCSADCVFCIKNYSDGVYGYDLRLEREPTCGEVIKELEGRNLSNYKEIVFTGFGEPLMRLDDVLEITRWLKEQGVRVRLDTIGHAKLLYPRRRVAEDLAKAGVDVVSISLNAQDEETYNKLCLPKFRSAYSSMLEFSAEVREAGIGLRFTVVSLPLVDIEKCRRIAEEFGADFKVRGYG